MLDVHPCKMHPQNPIMSPKDMDLLSDPSHDGLLDVACSEERKVANSEGLGLRGEVCAQGEYQVDADRNGVRESQSTSEEAMGKRVFEMMRLN